MLSELTYRYHNNQHSTKLTKISRKSTRENFQNSLQSCVDIFGDYYEFKIRFRGYVKRDIVQCLKVLIRSIMLGVVFVSAAVFLLHIGLPNYRCYNEVDGFFTPQGSIDKPSPGTYVNI